ncbi:hypothetical protein DFH06DRAFT_1123311 [Mycena polygramma]|nr:hypothetical protein DFH06DRAFT_1123311 [Mycena polygramma]
MSNLFDPKDLIAFILTPFIAALLIAEDRTIALSDAHDIRDQSNEFGDFMQPRDDNAKTLRPRKASRTRSLPKRRRGIAKLHKYVDVPQIPCSVSRTSQNVGPILVAKGVGCTILTTLLISHPLQKATPKAKPKSKSKRTLSLTEFNEPQSKTKPKQSAAKTTRPKLAVSPNAVSSSYGTRSKSKTK